MTDGPSPPPSPPTTAQAAFAGLREKRRTLAQQLASLRAELRALEKAEEALEPHAKGDLIRLAFTKDDTLFLAALCSQFADRFPNLGSETCGLLKRLGDQFLRATYDQNAEFALQLRALSGKPTNDPSTGSSGAESSTRKLPKRDRPYLRYTDAQLEAALTRSELGSRHDYVITGYVRLHLSRAALLEMYRKPRHVSLVYAYLLKAIDEYKGLGCMPILDNQRDAVDEPRSSKIKPYAQLSENDMLQALRTLGISPGRATFSYGFLTISLYRRDLLRLHRTPAGNPAIAYLIKRLDEFRQRAG